ARPGRDGGAAGIHADAVLLGPRRVAARLAGRVGVGAGIRAGSPGGGAAQKGRWGKGKQQNSHGNTPLISSPELIAGRARRNSIRTREPGSTARAAMLISAAMPELHDPSPDSLAALARIAGERHVLSGGDAAAYLAEPRDLVRGRAAMVLRPDS